MIFVYNANHNSEFHDHKKYELSCVRYVRRNITWPTKINVSEECNRIRAVHAVKTINRYDLYEKSYKITPRDLSFDHLPVHAGIYNV
jgi:hypothetical protein